MNLLPSDRVKIDIKDSHNNSEAVNRLQGFEGVILESTDYHVNVLLDVGVKVDVKPDDIERIEGRMKHEIVGAKIGNTVTNSPSDIIVAIKSGRTDIDLLDRRRMVFMAGFDLGKKWEILATSRTLFEIESDEPLGEWK
jgi:hypothetical protein